MVFQDRIYLPEIHTNGVLDFIELFIDAIKSVTHVTFQALDVAFDSRNVILEARDITTKFSRLLRNGRCDELLKVF